ncbi:MAG: hypothetical protein ACI8RZ_003741 [Myxococcota bacterium]|jgi:hypothetical protein
MRWCGAARKSMASTINTLNSPVRGHPSEPNAPRLRSQRRAVQGRQHQCPRFSHRWSQVVIPTSRLPTLQRLSHRRSGCCLPCTARPLGFSASWRWDDGGCSLTGFAEVRHRRRHSFSGHSAPPRACRPACGAAFKGAAFPSFVASRLLSPVTAPCDPRPDTNYLPPSANSKDLPAHLRAPSASHYFVVIA